MYFNNLSFVYMYFHVYKTERQIVYNDRPIFISFSLFVLLNELSERDYVVDCCELWVNLPKLNGRELHIKSVIISSNRYNVVYRAFQGIIRKTSKSGFRLSWAFAWEPVTNFHHLQQPFNQECQPFISASHCYRW